jgi:hypothetical protein
MAMQKGQLDSARNKARTAQNLGVTYGVFDDRPEHVLADIDRLRKAREAKRKK